MINLITILLITLFGNTKNLDSDIKEYLNSKLAGYEKFEYEISRMPKGFSKIEIDESREFTLNYNNALVPVMLFDRRNNSSKSVLNLKLKLYKYVLVSTKAIKKGDNLANKDFSLQLEDVALNKGTLIDKEQNLGVYRANTIIKPGSVLYKEQLEFIPDINKGEKLVLHTGSFGVDVTLDVIARQDGLIGEVISVSNGSKIFKAKVIDNYNLSLVE